MLPSSRARSSRSFLLLYALLVGAAACGGSDPQETAGDASASGDGTTMGDTSASTDGSTSSASGPSSATTGTADDTAGPTVTSTDTSMGSSGDPTEGTSGTDGSSSSDGSSDGTSDTGETGNPDAPGPVIDLRALPSNASVYVVWNLPDDPDLSGVLVARATGEPVEGVPVDGTSYMPGDDIGNAEVVFASDGLNALDLPLQNGTTYHYRAWAFDLDLNYSVGSADDATPQDARPTNLDSYEVAMGGEITALRVAFDESEQAHAAVRVDTGVQEELRYATCDSGCDAADDWEIAIVDTSISNRAAIALDSLARPRMAYPRSGSTYFARCDNACGVGANWSYVALPGTTAGTAVIDVDVGGRTWVVGGSQQLEISWCDNGCTNGANWTTVTLDGSYFYKHDLLHTSTDQRVLIASRYDANYSTRLLRCTGACENPNDWSEETVGNTSGSVYPLAYRFTADELGARTVFPYDGRYRECESCAPDLPPLVYDFTSNEIYYAALLQLDAEDQPRMFVRQSSGGMDYLLCDYDCSKASNWMRVEDLLPQGEALGNFVVGSDGMPIGVGHANINPMGLRLYRGVSP